MPARNSYFTFQLQDEVDPIPADLRASVVLTRGPRRGFVSVIDKATNRPMRSVKEDDKQLLYNYVWERFGSNYANHVKTTL